MASSTCSNASAASTPTPPQDARITRYDAGYFAQFAPTNALARNADLIIEHQGTTTTSPPSSVMF